MKKLLDDLVTVYETGNSSSKIIKKVLGKESLKNLSSISGLLISCNPFCNIAVVFHLTSERIISILCFHHLLLSACQLKKSPVFTLCCFPLIISIWENFCIFSPLHSIFQYIRLKKPCFLLSIWKSDGYVTVDAL